MIFHIFDLVAVWFWLVKVYSVLTEFLDKFYFGFQFQNFVLVLFMSISVLQTLTCSFIFCYLICRTKIQQHGIKDNNPTCEWFKEADITASQVFKICSLLVFFKLNNCSSSSSNNSNNRLNNNILEDMAMSVLTIHKLEHH